MLSRSARRCFLLGPFRFSVSSMYRASIHECSELRVCPRNRSNQFLWESKRAKQKSMRRRWLLRAAQRLGKKTARHRNTKKTDAVYPRDELSAESQPAREAVRPRESARRRTLRAEGYYNGRTNGRTTDRENKVSMEITVQQVATPLPLLLLLYLNAAFAFNHVAAPELRHVRLRLNLRRFSLAISYWSSCPHLSGTEQCARLRLDWLHGEAI